MPVLDTLLDLMAGRTFSPKKLRKMRKAAGLSMYRVAKDAGMYYSNYWGMETGKRPRPSGESLSKLAEVLKCSIEDFLA